MQALFVLLVAVVVGSVVWYIVSTIRIMDYLQKHGQKINWFLIRLLIIKYVSQYREMTKNPDGTSDPLYRQWVTSVSVMGVAALAAVAVRLMR